MMYIHKSPNPLGLKQASYVTFEGPSIYMYSYIWCDIQIISLVSLQRDICKKRYYHFPQVCYMKHTQQI